MASLLNLAADLKKMREDFDKRRNALIVKVVTKVTDDLHLHTPIDTTKAQSNWLVSLNVAIGDSDEIAPYVPERRNRDTRNKPTSSMRVARNAIAAELAHRKSGDTVYISNVVDYVQYLNQGSSRQEPAGFFERAVLIGRSELRKSKI